MIKIMHGSESMVKVLFCKTFVPLRLCAGVSLCVYPTRAIDCGGSQVNLKAFAMEKFSD